MGCEVARRLVLQRMQELMGAWRAVLSPVDSESLGTLDLPPPPHSPPSLCRTSHYFPRLTFLLLYTTTSGCCCGVLLSCSSLGASVMFCCLGCS